MNTEMEKLILQNTPWVKLPSCIKEVMHQSQKEYDKHILDVSIKNQLKFRGNLVQRVHRDEPGYYKQLVEYSRCHLMLYPYHLSEYVIKGLRLTPFEYYISVVRDCLQKERSYDSLPNFTAADCLRLLGIGRNEYIELMNQCRRGMKQRLRRDVVLPQLPTRPVPVLLLPSWRVDVGRVMQDDIKFLVKNERDVIDLLIDEGSQIAGRLDQTVVHSLYMKGLIYIDVPVSDDDRFSVPPLEGFVMNRVLGDYFEKLLYQIFVSIDERTSVAELSTVLQIDLQLVKNAVSLYCRLGFACKKTDSWNDSWNDSWKCSAAPMPSSPPSTAFSRIHTPHRDDTPGRVPDSSCCDGDVISRPAGPISPDEDRSGDKRIAFLFDSTLTAYLMMGNLSSGLKQHAVTMFEVGKLPDESLNSFIDELDNVNTQESEGEAERYFVHALSLRQTIRELRRNARLLQLPIDLVRCESLHSLDTETCSRLLNKNYRILVSMCPLSMESRCLYASCLPPHFGPPIPQVNSIWLKLFIYHLTGSGPPSFCLTRGTRLSHLPEVLLGYSGLLVTSWGHNSVNIPVHGALLAINDALTHSTVLIQGLSGTNDAETVDVTFPFDQGVLQRYRPAHLLDQQLSLSHSCGYVRLVRSRSGAESTRQAASPSVVPVRRRAPLACRPCGEHTTCSSSPDMQWSSRTAGATAASPGRGVDGASVSSSVSVLSADEASSDCHAPKNGLHDPEAAQLLAQELDGVPTEDTPLAASKHTEVDEWLPAASKDQWVLLECHFGLPLFDLNLCRSVTQTLSSTNAFDADRLSQLDAFNQHLSSSLLSFISDHQVCVGSSAPAGVECPSSHVDPLSRSVCFIDARLIPYSTV